MAAKAARRKYEGSIQILFATDYPYGAMGLDQRGRHQGHHRERRDLVRQEDRVARAHAAAHARRVQIGARGELFVVNRQDERAGAALLLGELGQIAIAGHAKHLKAFRFNRLSQRTNAQTRGVFGAVVFVNDDDGETEFHGRRRCAAPVMSNSGEV